MQSTSSSLHLYCFSRFRIGLCYRLNCYFFHFVGWLELPCFNGIRQLILYFAALLVQALYLGIGQLFFTIWKGVWDLMLYCFHIDYSALCFQWCFELSYFRAFHWNFNYLILDCNFFNLVAETSRFFASQNLIAERFNIDWCAENSFDFFQL